jgi:hypothetical protein
LKKEATKPAAQDFLQQQTKFDDFIDCYNHQRSEKPRKNARLVGHDFAAFILRLAGALRTSRSTTTRSSGLLTQSGEAAARVTPDRVDFGCPGVEIIYVLHVKGGIAEWRMT